MKKKIDKILETIAFAKNKNIMGDSIFSELDEIESFIIELAKDNSMFSKMSKSDK